LLTHLHRDLRRLTAAGASDASVYGQRSSTGLGLRPPAGPGFLCPVCGEWSRTFLPFGLDQRRRARCPVCGALERHRFVWLHLLDAWRLTRQRARLLHIAPEPCLRRRIAQLPQIRYVTADKFDPEVDLVRDLTDLGLPDGSFDRVICSHVLEHVPDDRTAMRELHRVLRPGGRALIMVPIDMGRPRTYEDPAIDTPAGRFEAFGHPYHVRIPGADYPERLREAGFCVRPVRSADSLSPHQRRRMRINKTLLFDCRRP